MSFASDAGSKRSFSAAAARVAPLSVSSSTNERAAMGGGVTGVTVDCANAGMASQARTAAMSFFTADFLSIVADGGGDAEGALGLLGDGVGLLARAIGAEAHAMQAIAIRDLHRLVQPGELARHVVAEALCGLGAGEGAELDPERRAFLRDH